MGTNDADRNARTRRARPVLLRYVHGLLNSFSTAEINALICPRPHLSLAGTFDRLTPSAGQGRIDTALKAVYAEAGVPERWQLVGYASGHPETADMRRRTLEFLDRYLLGCEAPSPDC